MKDKDREDPLPDHVKGPPGDKGRPVDHSRYQRRRRPSAETLARRQFLTLPEPERRARHSGCQGTVDVKTSGGSLHLNDIAGDATANTSGEDT